MTRALFAICFAVVAAGCGTNGHDVQNTNTDGGPASALDATLEDGATVNPNDAAASGDGGCGPLTCKDGCCKNGVCAGGTLPNQCGGGGLACVDCTVYNMGCVNKGCAVATCTNCDGCCQAGTCNTNGKTQDNACGKGGAVCQDCTTSNRTCDGNGSCH